MYWPSVQEDVSSVSALARGMLLATPRLFGRRVLLDLTDQRCEDLSGSLMQPLRALLQPISDKLSWHMEIAAAAFNQATTSPAVNLHTEQHEKSACKR